MTDDVRRVAWIVGAGSGVGRAAALSLTAAGWRVVLSGRRVEALEQTAALVGTAGGEAEVLPFDVRVASTQTADAALARWGRVDGLVAAAGLNSPKRTWADQSIEDFASIVDTNLTGVVRVIDVALPALRAARGVIVVVSSYAAWAYGPGAGVAYSASKTALAPLVRTLNSQEAASGVRACHLCPGDIDTDFLTMRPSVPDAEARSVMLAPADVGDAIRFVMTLPAHVRIDELVLSPVSQT